VGGEDRGRPEAQPRVDLGEGEPLDVQHVGPRRRQPTHHVEVLDGLQRQAQARARAPEEARRERVERLGAPVALGRGQVAEAEAGRRELDVGARAGDMLRLATADDPDVLCVQEVPAWALPRFTVGDVASRPPLGAKVGRLLTAPNHGVVRSAVSGQGNAIRLSPRLRLLAHRAEVLNPAWFRREEGRRLGLGRVAQLAWARERRLVQAVRAQLPDGRTLTVANLHCTSYETDPRLADAELLRAAAFARDTALGDEPVVVAGDFNLRSAASGTLAALTGPECGFSAAGPAIDHVLVRGLAAGPAVVWPEERRRLHDGTLLSDHAPVEVEVG
jgi:endonuclease/exonuclease/phosphatase family metal-dependent hydrolase